MTVVTFTAKETQKTIDTTKTSKPSQGTPSVWQIKKSISLYKPLLIDNIIVHVQNSIDVHPYIQSVDAATNGKTPNKVVGYAPPPIPDAAHWHNKDRATANC